MGLLVKTLDALFPYRKAAKQQLRSAADGAQWIRADLERLKASTKGATASPPKDLGEARSRFSAAAQRHGRTSVQELRVVELDFARRQMVAVAAALISLSLGLAGIILMAIDSFWSGIGLSLGLPLGGYALVSALRFGLRRYQVKQRALVPLPVYVGAVGGWLPAILFGEPRE